MVVNTTEQFRLHKLKIEELILSGNEYSAYAEYFKAFKDELDKPENIEYKTFAISHCSDCLNK